MPTNEIFVKGAREHNLKNIDVRIPRDKLVVITGLSGSGKSSLAFDTIYAEGQRRYVESLSAYARQFLGRMEKPDVDYIEGLSPAISIDQKGASHNPRSTVGTVTEIYDYLRLLYARAGRPHCYNCGRPIQQQTVQQIVDAIQDMPVGKRLLILGPLVQDRKGEHQGLLEDAKRAGFVRVRVDGQVKELTEEIDLEKNKRHTVEVVVDRLVIREEKEGLRGRITDSVETSLKLGSGIMTVADNDTGDEQVFSEKFACVHCGISVGEIEPRTFSFNSPHGACPECTGLGYKLMVDPDLVIPNRDLTLAEGAVVPWQRAGTMTRWYQSILHAAAEAMDIPVNVPVRELTDEQVDALLYGPGEESDGASRRLPVRHRSRGGRVFNFRANFEGVIPNMERRYKETESEWARTDIERYMTTHPCEVCQGKRLKPSSLAVTVDGKNIMEATAQPIDKAQQWIRRLEQEPGVLTERESMIAAQILKEIQARLTFLVDVGLDYITLDRTAMTLSGGESQRIRLATQIGSGLMGVLYICDEPSIGLHPVDNHRLIATLQRLRNLGNTIIVVEHDEAIMREADFIVDMGPGAGEHGGHVVAVGTLEDILKSERSITGAYLSGRKYIPIPPRRPTDHRWITVRGARGNNLKNIDVSLPLGVLVCVTGVSGSGKSTLVRDILHKRMAQYFYRAKDRPGDHDAVEGLEHIDKVIDIDQSPIGRTPRSNPATYTGAFGPIRELFASIPEARARGYQAGRFSFNVKGGRCEACGGDGYTQIEMQFLPDVTVPCDVCHGARYNREALEILFRGKNISDVLNMTVSEALEHFSAFPKVASKLRTLEDVGLGYIRLGQPATTLSGGEAQRVKLATELSRRATGRTLYILDEPTTGLSFADTHALLGVLQRLVDQGNSVLLIEHHLDMIKSADWIVDLGPGAGEKGGRVVATGTPEQVAAVENSYTGQYLRQVLEDTSRRMLGAAITNGHAGDVAATEDTAAPKKRGRKARTAAG